MEKVGATEFGLRSLRDLDLRPEYNTEDNDIVADFLGPCLGVAVSYDRAVGFFRANIYRELGEELLDFVAAGGRVRVVCSPDIPERDEEAAREGYKLRGSRSPEELETDLIEVMEAMSSDPLEKDCLEMLRLLIEKGSLDLFVAVRPGGIYHRKIGIFSDSNDDTVVFSGSGNETRPAVTAIEDWSNDEEFDVYRSWGEDFERDKAARKAAYLEQLFKGGTKSTKVRPLTEVERSFLARFRSHRDLEDSRPGAKRRSPRWIDRPDVAPYFYQRQAIEAWERAGRVGILSMATGTGKTYTALFGIRRIVERGHPVVFIVPTQVLFDQWERHLRKFFPGVPILLAGAGHDWKADPQKRMYVADAPLPRMILATMRTASSDDFLEFLGQSEDLTLVADEVHRVGSPTYRRILTLGFRAKLGLSATPERLWDQEGSEALTQQFGTEPVFQLPINASVRIREDSSTEVPILGRILSPYNYDFELVRLTRAEQDQWNSLSEEIRKTIARDPSQLVDGLISGASPRLRMLLIKRARIVKKASNKVEAAGKVISEQYPPEGRWLVYCEDMQQLDEVTAQLRTVAKGVVIMKYDSRMEGSERRRVLSYFEENPSIIVCIRCLDEGVDVPKADGAVILASSKNPREYIQRRGRVLRKAVEKGEASIVDAIVLPVEKANREEDPVSIVRSELARAYTFAQNSLNKEVTHRLWRICQDYDVDLDVDPKIGVQDESLEA